MAKREQLVVGSLVIAGSQDRGTEVKGLDVYSGSIIPAATAANMAVEQVFAAFNANMKVATDVVMEVTQPSALPAGLSMAGGRISANGSLAITFVNSTAGVLTAPAGVYKAVVIKT